MKTVQKQGKLSNYLMDPGARHRREEICGAQPASGHADGPDPDRTLRPKISARFGGRIKAMVSGGAPLNPTSGCSSTRSG
jgi:long-chain acyl-CoA synthetase